MEASTTEQELNALLAAEKVQLDAEMSLEEAAARSAAALLDYNTGIPSVEQVDQVASPRTNLRAAINRKPVPMTSSLSTSGKKRSSKTGTKKKRSKKSKTTSSSKTKSNTSSVGTSRTSSTNNNNNNNNNNNRKKITTKTPSSSSTRTTSIKPFRNSSKTSNTASMRHNESRLTPRTSSFTLSSRPQSSSSVEDTLRIRELEHEVSLLRSDQEKTKSRHQKQLSEAETKSTLYGAQVDRLAHQIESLVSRNANTSAQKVEADMNAREAQDRVDQLETNSATLRKLLTELLGNPSEQNIRSMEEQTFWDQIATPEIMAKSRPPNEYVVPSVEMVQAHPVYSQELDTARARLRITDQELKRVKNDLESLQKQLVTVRSSSSSRDTTAQAMIARQRKWLMGTVRRIKWVIKKRTETEAILKDRDAYVGKLETKLLHQAMTIRKQRSAIRASRGDRYANSNNNSNNNTRRNVPKAPSNTGPRTMRGGGKSGKKPDQNNTNAMTQDGDEAARKEARSSLQVRAQHVVDGMHQTNGPPSPHLRKTLSSIMSNDDPDLEQVESKTSTNHRVAAVPMSPLKSPAPKTKREERSALDVLAEDEDGEFDMADIAAYTKTLTEDLYSGAVQEELAKKMEE